MFTTNRCKRVITSKAPLLVIMSLFADKINYVYYNMSTLPTFFF